MSSLRSQLQARQRWNRTKAALHYQAHLPLPERTLRNNILLHIANGSFAGFSDALTSTALVMTAFLSQLTTSNILIAMLSPLRDAGWFLPQFFMAPLIERTRRKVTAYRAGTFLRLGAWAALVLSTFLIHDRALLLIAVFTSLAVFSVVAGFAALPFLIVTSKVIPPNHFGLVFGLRQFISGGLGIAAGGAVALLLGGQSGLPFPQNYALVFAVAGLGYTLSYTALGAIREEPDASPAQIPSMLANLKRAWAIGRADQQYRLYVVMRIALLIGTAGVPFLTVYAKRVLAVSDGFIGSLVSVTLASGLLSNIVWARLCDRRGNHAVMRVTTAMGVLFCLLSALVTGFPASAYYAGVEQALLLGLFALSGAMLAGINLVSNPLMIEIAQPAQPGQPSQQSLYIGLSNTILGVVILFTSLVGVIVDHFGYSVLFVFCALACTVALERLLHMRPRQAIAATKAMSTQAGASQAG